MFDETEDSPQSTTGTTNDVEEMDEGLSTSSKRKEILGRTRRENADGDGLDKRSPTKLTRTRGNGPRRNGERYDGTPTERSGGCSGEGVRRCMELKKDDEGNRKDEIQGGKECRSQERKGSRVIARRRMVCRAAGINDVGVGAGMVRNSKEK